MTTLSPKEVKSLILASIHAREFAYVPYSNFSGLTRESKHILRTWNRVGAALLAETGTIIRGCNVENASYGGCICAERTAITKAISDGITKFVAIAVSSDVAAPTTSPCGICRQVIREFCADTTPIYMVSSTFPSGKLCAEDDVMAAIEDVKHVRKVTLGDLLPMSFGPENLGKGGHQKQ